MSEAAAGAPLRQALRLQGGVGVEPLFGVRFAGVLALLGPARLRAPLGPEVRDLGGPLHPSSTSPGLVDHRRRKPRPEGWTRTEDTKRVLLARGRHRRSPSPCPLGRRSASTTHASSGTGPDACCSVGGRLLPADALPVGVRLDPRTVTRAAIPAGQSCCWVAIAGGGLAAAARAVNSSRPSTRPTRRPRTSDRIQCRSPNLFPQVPQRALIVGACPRWQLPARLRWTCGSYRRFPASAWRILDAGCLGVWSRIRFSPAPACAPRARFGQDRPMRSGRSFPGWSASWCPSGCARRPISGFSSELDPATCRPRRTRSTLSLPQTSRWPVLLDPALCE